MHIAGIVGEEFDALNAGRIRTYIPTLVERGARVRLKASSESAPPKTNARDATP